MNQTPSQREALHQLSQRSAEYHAANSRWFKAMWFVRRWWWLILLTAFVLFVFAMRTWDIPMPAWIDSRSPKDAP